MGDWRGVWGPIRWSLLIGQLREWREMERDRERAIETESESHGRRGLRLEEGVGVFCGWRRGGWLDKGRVFMDPGPVGFMTL